MAYFFPVFEDISSLKMCLIGLKTIRSWGKNKVCKDVRSCCGDVPVTGKLSYIFKRGRKLSLCRWRVLWKKKKQLCA